VAAAQEALDRKLAMLETHHKARPLAAAWACRWPGYACANVHTCTCIRECKLGRLGACVPGQLLTARGLDQTKSTTKPKPQEVHDALASVEAEAERLAGGERALLDADASERDRLYARAEVRRMMRVVVVVWWGWGWSRWRDAAERGGEGRSPFARRWTLEGGAQTARVCVCNRRYTRPQALSGSLVALGEELGGVVSEVRGKVRSAGRVELLNLRQRVSGRVREEAGGVGRRCGMGLGSGGSNAGW
jgi:hypothetical protein